MPTELSEEDLALLDVARQQLADGKLLCQKMRAAGYDTSAQDAFCSALDARLNALIEQFGRGKRAS